MADIRKELHLEAINNGFEDENKRREINLFSGRLCNRLSQMTTEYSDSKITPHNLRALYTALAWYCSQTGCPYPYFAKHILGHETSLATSSYDQLRVQGLDSLSFLGDFDDSHLMEIIAQ
jgi:integrase